MQRIQARSITLVLTIFLLGVGLAKAEESFVTIWAGGITSSTNDMSRTRLTIKTNETAYLVSWPQLEFHYSFLTINSGVNSFMLKRKPELEVSEKTKQVKEHGILLLPAVVVTGPATLEFSVPTGYDIFCTFRIVHAPSSTIKSSDK